jgi:glycosyltransferase involved in cell wall biosynthesis
MSILVPVWNEEARLPTCLEHLLDYASRERDLDVEIIVCSDGCTDRTLEIVNDYAKKYSQIKVANWPERLGKGGGTINGLRIADGDIVVVFDADLSTPASQISRLTSIIISGAADLAIGSRNVEGSIITEQPLVIRKILGKSFNFLFRMLFEMNFHDTQCGFKAIRTSVFKELSERMLIEGFAFDIDLIVRAIRRGYKVIEVPVTWGYRKGSKVDVTRQISEMLRSLLIVWLETKKRDPLAYPSELMMKSFYDSVPGDTYYFAERSLFLPRRLWHAMKNRQIERGVEKHSKVLEVGCGSGTVFGRLLPSRSVYAMDIGKGFVNFCHEKYKGNDDSGLVVADARYIPFRTETFDYVICSEVLEHLWRPETALQEFHSILRPNGRLIITTPNISVRWGLVEAIWTRIRRRMIETGHTAFSERRIRYLLLKRGFHILECRRILFGCILFFTAKKTKR